VIVEAMDEGGHTRNYLELGATIAGPSGGSQRVALTQTGAGRYEGRFEADAPGAYLVTVREGEDELVGSAGVVRARGDELRGEGTDHALLARIAALTGGQVRDDLEGVFRERPASTFAYEPVWRPLVIASILLLLASVALRRLVLPGARRADAPVPVATAPAPAPSTIEPPPPAPPSAPPASLAETLLARKKTR
jgi:hypothetical protein